MNREMSKPWDCLKEFSLWVGGSSESRSRSRFESKFRFWFRFGFESKFAFLFYYYYYSLYTSYINRIEIDNSIQADKSSWSKQIDDVSVPFSMLNLSLHVYARLNFPRLGNETSTTCIDLMRLKPWNWMRRRRIETTMRLDLRELVKRANGLWDKRHLHDLSWEWVSEWVRDSKSRNVARRTRIQHIDKFSSTQFYLLYQCLNEWE